jgi:hypothetical protein
MKNGYISIQEYAKIKGISTQAVYKQLTTKLTTYVVEVDNHKMLKISVLDEDLNNQVDNRVANHSTKVDNQVAIDSRYIERLEKDIEYLRKTLDEERQAHREDNARHTAEIERLTTAIINEQSLRLVTAKEAIEDTATDEAPPEKKQGFFKRLFVKKMI